MSARDSVRASVCERVTTGTLRRILRDEPLRPRRRRRKRHRRWRERRPRGATLIQMDASLRPCLGECNDLPDDRFAPRPTPPRVCSRSAL